MRTKNPEYFRLIENFIDGYQEEYGSSPSTQEIADAVGLSKSGASKYLVYMRESAMIDYDGCRHIITKKQKRRREESIEVPVLGKVSCGVPKFAEGNIEEYVRLPVSLFGRGEFYILTANGDSMIDVGIADGDMVLIRHQNYADPGQIVVALMEDEATLKRYFPEPEFQRIRLHPENSEMNDIYVRDCMIQGVAVKVLKDLP